MTAACWPRRGGLRVDGTHLRDITAGGLDIEFFDIIVPRVVKRRRVLDILGDWSKDPVQERRRILKGNFGRYRALIVATDLKEIVVEHIAALDYSSYIVVILDGVVGFEDVRNHLLR